MKQVINRLRLISIKLCRGKVKLVVAIPFLICFWLIISTEPALAQRFGRYDDLAQVAVKQSDDFKLSYRYSVYYFVVGVWVKPEGYILYFPTEGKYNSLGDVLPQDIVQYYQLENNQPQPSTLKVIWIYGYGFLAEIILVSILLMMLLAKIKEYLRVKSQFERAIQIYLEKGGKDRTVIEILDYLKYRQKRQLYVSFKCNNNLKKELERPFKFTDGKKTNLISPYENFLQKNLKYLESLIVDKLNSSFSQIISNDVFFFVRGEATGKRCVFFQISYDVSETGALYFREGSESESFLGIAVNWRIDITINGKTVRKIELLSLPAKSFTVRSDSSGNVSTKKIFDKMAETAFSDLDRLLQKELNVDSLN